MVSSTKGSGEVFNDMNIEQGMGEWVGRLRCCAVLGGLRGREMGWRLGGGELYSFSEYTERSFNGLHTFSARRILRVATVRDLYAPLSTSHISLSLMFKTLGGLVHSLLTFRARIICILLCRVQLKHFPWGGHADSEFLCRYW